VGLDLGPSTIAVVAEQEALLQPFCPEVTPNWRKLRRRTRQLDRQRRANNPEHYDERGRVKKGKHRWKVSKRQRKVQARRRDVYRRLSATRKRSHGQLAHRVLALGSTFQPRADLLPGVAEALWALGRTQCPWDVRLAPVSPG
jgi:transposase